MFEDYTTKQLVELRRLCAAMVERAANVEEAANALLVLDHIDEELAIRERKKTA